MSVNILLWLPDNPATETSADVLVSRPCSCRIISRRSPQPEPQDSTSTAQVSSQHELVDAFDHQLAQGRGESSVSD